MDGDGSVAGAGAAADQGNTGAAGQPGIGHGHETGAAFLPAGHQIDTRMRVQRVHDGDIAFAGNVETAVHAIFGEEGDEDFCGRFHVFSLWRISRTANHL